MLTDYLKIIISFGNLKLFEMNNENKHIRINYILIKYFLNKLV